MPLKADLVSIDLRYQLLLIVVYKNFLSVSFDAVGASFSKVFMLSFLNSRATFFN